MITFNGFLLSMVCYVHVSDRVKESFKYREFLFSIGTESASLVKRDALAEIEKITKYLQDISSMLTSTTSELVGKIKAHDLTSQAE